MASRPVAAYADVLLLTISAARSPGVVPKKRYLLISEATRGQSGRPAFQPRAKLTLSLEVFDRQDNVRVGGASGGSTGSVTA
jgi:hypothetical protein